MLCNLCQLKECHVNQRLLHEYKLKLSDIILWIYYSLFNHFPFEAHLFFSDYF